MKFKIGILEMFKIDPRFVGVLPGLDELMQEFSERFSDCGLPIAFEASCKANQFRISRKADGIRIEYHRPCDAYRALGSLFAGLCPEDGSFEQTCAFDSLGVMLDVSRNAVLRPDSIEALFRRFCLMGINSVHLYIEDVYSLPGEPFYGYGRGAYTVDELQQIDRYGELLGIEVVPCIQTLGHLEQVLQWPAYANYLDVPGVLLADYDKTYDLIAKQLDTMLSAFRTRTIHIGMDEAHGVGRGRYRDIYGGKRTFDILNSHLKKVVEMCGTRGLKPMMWSDMFFRIGSSTNDYYDTDSRVPEEVIEEIPEEVEMVYWDYYHEEPAFYEDWIDRHRLLGKEPIYASGAWTWGRFWACLERVMTTNLPGMKAARKKNLRNAFITAWGDDGTECHPFSMLASIQFFTECAYNEEPEPGVLEKMFSAICGGSFSGCVLASEVDTVPCVKGKSLPDANFGKWLLWHDPVLSFLSIHIPDGLSGHYRALANRLDAMEPGNGPIRFPALLARILSKKTQIHLDVRALYRAGDVKGVRRLIDDLLRPVRAEIRILWDLHHKIWMEWHKPFGWEVIECRYANICARLDRLEQMLEAFVASPSLRCPEFEYELQRIYPEELYPQMFFDHRRSRTPSALA